MVDRLWATLVVALGTAIVATALRNEHARRRVERNGFKLTALVVSDEASPSLQGGRTLHMKVRFQAPDGRWMEDVSARGHGNRRRPGDAVAVWYDPEDPTSVTVDEPGAYRSLVFWVVVGLAVVAFGVDLFVSPG